MAKPTNQIRIIGGRHRGRKIAFPDQTGLRPTGDRLRETLFNWLGPLIPGARCLDLFAGSGALGFEAASRGAASVVMVEKAKPVVRSLADAIKLLGLDQVTLQQSDALTWLESPPQPFDVVFLDPPFADKLLEPICKKLQQGWLADDARLYIEIDAKDKLPELPKNWCQLKEKKAGQVRYFLYRVESFSG
ncbi:MAG: 16S rRNA (guanine(966)-N(2))-methyltransferase RsmD [Candidatus Polarisedimenticolaceae bacterium]|nr:16S rRNA (guanine(966)-N(2))-methyltransferase RsmD [Candidatus Polarisedimenticolaceae bacterium]